MRSLPPFNVRNWPHKCYRICSLCKYNMYVCVCVCMLWKRATIFHNIYNISANTDRLLNYLILGHCSAGLFLQSSSRSSSRGPWRLLEQNLLQVGCRCWSWNNGVKQWRQISTGLNTYVTTTPELHCVSKKRPTFKFSVTLSHLNRFSKFVHYWKAYKIRYKSDMTLPTSP